ncbi:MAG: nuclear transport factor 2 family protein [Acidimicrobiales bacterium]
MTTNTITDTAQAHLAAVGRLYAAYGRGDIDAVLAEVADDVDWAAEAASNALPWYGPHHGKHEVPSFFEAIGSSLDISEFEIVGMTSNETDVITTVHWIFTVKATGKTANMYMQHWWRFADGKIVFFRGSEDSAQSVAAFQAD